MMIRAEINSWQVYLQHLWPIFLKLEKKSPILWWEQNSQQPIDHKKHGRSNNLSRKANIEALTKWCKNQ